jgi:hypothetical protein
MDSSLSNLFNNCKYRQASSQIICVASHNLPIISCEEKPKVDINDIQFKIIEKQMNQWLKQKNGQKHERVSLNNFNEIEIYDDVVQDEWIDKEVQKTMKKKRWNSLPKSAKWNLIQSYCEINNIDNTILDKYKNMLEKNIKIIISYDHLNGTITSIDNI